MWVRIVWSRMTLTFSKSSVLGLLVCAHAAWGSNGYTALEIQLSADGRTWQRNLTIAPGGTAMARVVASYEGRDQMHGLAWVNFQPIVRGVNEFDSLAPFVTSGNQSTGDVAYDKPEQGQEAYGRIYPYAATALGRVPGGQNTTLTRHDGIIDGQFAWRIAQARTTNQIGTGPASGAFAYNNTNGTGGVVCAQPPGEALFDGERSRDLRGVVLFAFATQWNDFTTQRNITFDLPIGGVSLFDQAAPSAGWFNTAGLSGRSITYVPVRTRAATLQIRGPIPTPGALVMFPIAALVTARRRSRMTVI